MGVSLRVVTCLISEFLPFFKSMKNLIMLILSNLALAVAQCPGAMASAPSGNGTGDAAHPPIELCGVAGKLHRFAVDQHEVLAAFAACKFAKNGKGALFVFTNCGLGDLLAEEGEAGFMNARKLKRQMIVVWVGVTDRAAEDCTLVKLTEKCDPQMVANITQSIENSGGSRETFPLIVLGGVKYATEDVKEVLRPVSGKTAENGYGVLGMQFGDYREALKIGLGHDFEDALVVELDDEQ